MLDVAIIGGGPAGLATAIECGRKRLSHVVLEKGALVDAIRRFPVNMVFFTTPELLEIFIENGRFHGKKIVEHVAGS
jgi:thioredoxin reductase (NADPH)